MDPIHRQGSRPVDGGRFGVESSVLALVLCTTTGIVMLVMAVKRGKIVPPFWKRPPDPLPG
jgi:hypothetical protein